MLFCSDARGIPYAKRLFEIIETASANDTASAIYDYFMMFVILASLVPLAFKARSTVFYRIDSIACVVFLLDYLLRLMTADLKLPKHGKYAFLFYPFTPFAIIDLLSILPSLIPINAGFRLLRLFRLFRTFRVFRSLKLLRYSKNFEMIANVFRKQRRSLGCVFSFAAAYILISALIVFNVEPDSFASFF
jgi:voltage-gated potassium channel